MKLKGRSREVLVSAIIAAYNEEEHIDQCIESLINQSYSKIEIIVVENGESTDRTLEISRKYQSLYPNIRVFSIPGKQGGPGNAWNFGVNKANGDVILIVGADLIYGIDYVKNGIKYIINGDIGIVHKEELCKNNKNLWARAFFNKRITVDSKGLSKVFSLIKKESLKKTLFDPKLGYADDQTIYIKKGLKFKGVELEVYHTNPSSFADTWNHTVWVGKSLKKEKVILILPFFPIYILYKTFRHIIDDFYIPFIIFLPFYYLIRYFAYLSVAIRSKK